MAQRHAAILNHPVVLAALKQAWNDSDPGITGGHEEGGFILQDLAGNLTVLRWPKGAQNSIIVPPHPGCKIGESLIVATFHTHPNTGSDHLQEPSETDKRAIRDDSDLKGDFYEGELVISQEKIYLIAATGEVREAWDSREVFAEE